MNYVGIDIHKRYSVCATQDEQGRKLRGSPNRGQLGFGLCVNICKAWRGRARLRSRPAGTGARSTTGSRRLPQVEEVVVAHPLKTRLIGEAQIKSDKIDAAALAHALARQLHRAGARAGEGGRTSARTAAAATLFARLRTAMRNRIHALLDRQEKLELPQCRVSSGTRGAATSRRLGLPEPDGTLLARPGPAGTAQRSRSKSRKSGSLRGMSRMKRPSWCKRAWLGRDPGRGDRKRD